MKDLLRPRPPMLVPEDRDLAVELRPKYTLTSLDRDDDVEASATRCGNAAADTSIR